MDEEIVLDGCSSHYIHHKNISVHFDPIKDKCKEYFAKGKDKICKDFGSGIHCDARRMVEQNPSCFALHNLIIEYECKGKCKV